MEKVEILKNNVIYRVWKEVLHKLSHEDSHQQQSTRKDSKQNLCLPGSFRKIFDEKFYLSLISVQQGNLSLRHFSRDD